jgi:hypothetical protein
LYFVFYGLKGWSWRKHFPESLRLEIYVFRSLIVKRIGSGGLLLIFINVLRVEKIGLGFRGKKDCDATIESRIFTHFTNI